MLRYPVLIALLAAPLAAQENAVTGQYLEDRDNRVYGCPCEWSSEFVNNGRQAILAWNILSGSFQGEKLEGLRMAAVVVSDFSLSAGWARRRSVLYLDSAAPGPQRRAGEAWLRSRYGDTLGRVDGVHAVPIEFRFTADAAGIAIPDVLRVDMRRARLEDDTQPWAALLYEPFTRLSSATLGTPLQTRYSGTDLNVRWTRVDAAITGYYGAFSTR